MYNHVLLFPEKFPNNVQTSNYMYHQKEAIVCGVLTSTCGFTNASRLAVPSNSVSMLCTLWKCFSASCRWTSVSASPSIVVCEHVSVC